jgi:hypothetical protein
MNDYSKMFFNMTRGHNSTNWRKLVAAFQDETPTLNQPTWKALSSLVTRYWLFIEKNPDMSESDRHMLYYILGIDRIGKLIATHPRCSDEDFRSLQEQLLPIINEVLLDEQKSRV